MKKEQITKLIQGDRKKRSNRSIMTDTNEENTI